MRAYLKKGSIKTGRDGVSTAFTKSSETKTRKGVKTRKFFCEGNQEVNFSLDFASS